MSADWQGLADSLAERALRAGDATGWFEELYAAGRAGQVDVPWDRAGPREPVLQWARERGGEGSGRRAVVVGAGLGFEAELVAGLGYATTAFDVSPTAVELARGRHPGSRVTYAVADLLALPEEWRRAYDLVVEVYTVQALPRDLRARATAAVRDLVAPGGTLVVVQAATRVVDEDGPPWPLTRDEVDAFAGDGVEAVDVRLVADGCTWLAELRRTGPAARVEPAAPPRRPTAMTEHPERRR